MAVYTTRKSRFQRLLRLLGSTIDPRAWAHMVKIVNYYNYTHVQERRKATISPTVRLSPNAGFANAENITIEANASIGAYCQLWAGPGSARIIIGRDALLAPDVMLTATNYNFNEGQPVADQTMTETEIVIGADCWIGRGVTVLAGTDLGEGSIVGAHSVVRGKFPPNSILAGSPARVVGTRQISSMS